MLQKIHIKGSIHTKWISCLLVLSLLLLIFFSFQPEAFALSIEDETKMGKEFLYNIRSQFALVEDDYANHYFNELGNYLITPLETKPFPFHFHIIINSDLNAFAAPGGHIFFFSGLIEALDSIDELTAVLCHEIGHVSARHLAQRIDQNKTIGLATLGGILLGILVGGEAGGALITGSMAGGIQAQLHFSRDDERQADQLSFKYMKSLGFNPAGLISALKKIGRERWFGPSKVPPYLLTHPTGPERMSNLDTMLSQFEPQSAPPESARFRSGFSTFRTLVLAETLEPQLAEEHFNDELKKNPGSALPHLGLGIAFMRRNEYDRAIDQLKQAQKLSPDFTPIIANLVRVYQMMGQDRKAITVLEEATKRYSEDSALFYLLAVSYENLEQYEEAIEIFEKLASYKPVKNDIYYHLGISYGRVNKLALAHYNFGIYYKHAGPIQTAIFHFKKAHSLTENDRSLREKIQRESKDLDQRGRSQNQQNP